ncbi:MAG: NhaP-type Na+/H+ and K+/H+ antiporters with a unique C-terminal domain protein, partial [uncultured archaeon A07HB70]
PIRESVQDLPEDVVIGAITRDDDLVAPRGDTVVEAGDHLVVFTTTEAADRLTTSV